MQLVSREPLEFGQSGGILSEEFAIISAFFAIGANEAAKLRSRKIFSNPAIWILHRFSPSAYIVQLMQINHPDCTM
jgi:hypothetical protein